MNHVKDNINYLLIYFMYRHEINICYLLNTLCYNFIPMILRMVVICLFKKGLKGLDSKLVGLKFIENLEKEVNACSLNAVEKRQLTQSKNIAQLFYNLALIFKKKDKVNYNIFQIILEAINDYIKILGLTNFNINTFRWKGWLLASFILNPKLSCDSDLKSHFEAIIYTKLNTKSISLQDLIRYLSNLMEYSKKSLACNRYEIIIDLIGKINELPGLNISSFARKNDVRNAGKYVNNLCLDLIMCFERQEGIPELQTFIKSIMGLSSKEIGEELLRGLMLIHKHYEFSLSNSESIVRYSAVNAITCIGNLLKNPKINVAKLIDYLRFIATLDLPVISTKAVLTSLVNRISKEVLDYNKTIEVNWSLMLLKHSGHNGIRYLDIQVKSDKMHTLDASHAAMLFQFLSMEGSYELHLYPEAKVNKSKTESAMIPIINEFLNTFKIQYIGSASKLYKGLEIDFFVELQCGSKIAFNIDGPFHFLSNMGDIPCHRLNKVTKIRNAMQRKLGLIVICIDYRDNNSIIRKKIMSILPLTKNSNAVHAAKINNRHEQSSYMPSNETQLKVSKENMPSSSKESFGCTR